MPTDTTTTSSSTTTVARPRPSETLLVEVGKRNSAKDAAMIQQAHDLLRDLGATCYGDDESEEEEESGEMEEAQIVADGPVTDVRFQEASYDAHLVSLAEASPIFEDDARTVWITPIRPGWGNSRDNNYYPVNTLREAVDKRVFNSLKMYKDHPRKSDEKELPERSVKDWFATTREAVWDEARGEPRVPVVVHDDDDYRRFKDVPEQIAFSVLGSGSGRPGAVDGKKGRIIEAIARLRSVDWVTEAGAGGAIAFAESAAIEESDMEIMDLTAEDLREGNPRLYEHLIGLGKALAGMDAEEKKAAKEAEKAAAEKAAEKPVEDAGTTEAPTKESETPAWATALVERIERIETRETHAAEDATRIEEAKATTTEIVGAALAESTLPGTAKDIIAGRFADMTVGEDMDFPTKEELASVIEAEIKAATDMLAPFIAESKVTGLGATVEDEASVGVREAAMKAVSDRFGMSPTPAKSKLVWTADELSGTPEKVVEATDEGGPIAESETVLSEAGQKALAAINARL